MRRDCTAAAARSYGGNGFSALRRGGFRIKSSIFADRYKPKNKRQ
ncbi:hypothetical protein HMPREF9136_1921 [Prevotella dentalis DSM 3688]|uniref:Uncharacterized protein n=1 Tax=Prevotella dentalis (strain ATCC 49559 / DSM 3688 / JCM 13448 / NCTC 12043 / ES 2772) TaxID=908937 RepID=F9D4Z3_PREDD|nr:hypothetical protein HMPREF9136_1921 [Prevotella dentalis DSM 3688]